MLTLVVALVVSQSAAVTLTSPKSTHEKLVSVLRGRAFTKAELSALETAALTASREPIGMSCDSGPRGLCDRNEWSCTSRFALIFFAVDNRGQSTPRFVELAAELVREGTEPFALPAARHLLAKAKHPLVEAEGIKLINDGSYDCVNDGLLMLAGIGTLSDTARVAVESQLNGANTYSVGSFLATRSEPWAHQLAHSSLRSSDTRLRMGLIRAVKAPPSQALHEALVFAARCDPTRRLRNEATARLKEFKLPIPAVECPNPTWRVEGRMVTDGIERVQLINTSNTPPCDGGIGLFGSRCILALNRGEFGGELGVAARDGGVEFFADGTQAIALLRRGDETFVVNALHHLSGSGSLGQLINSNDGGLDYLPQRRFVAAPLAWAFTSEQLIVEFAAHEMTSPCAWKRGDTVVMIYERDGGSSLASSPSTACLTE